MVFLQRHFPETYAMKTDSTYVSDELVKYVLPLIQGESKAPLEDGLPRFAKLKKVQAGRK